MLPGVILTAGDSSRMGSPKALLPDPSGVPFLLRILHTLHDAGVDDIVVVTGRHHDPITRMLAAAEPSPRPRVVRNTEPSRGQLSSLQLGMSEVNGDETAGMLVTLVDIPLVGVDTVRQVVEAWRRSRAPIVRPICAGRRGHPVIFDRAVFDELTAAPLDGGARSVVRAHHHDSLDVPVEDRGCLVDVDTPDDYRELRGS
jgi:molybdenum cofactor cytidylyltransferase